MKKHQNKYLLNKRLEFLNYAKTHIANNGLKQNTFKDISNKYKLDLNETELLFPEGNVDLIKFAFTEIKNFFFFGYGIGGFENIFQIKFINSYYWYADHAHSDLVEFFGEFGIIGILLFILSFIKFFLIKKNYSLINSLVLIYLSLILLFDFSLHIPIIQLLFIIFFYINKKSYGSSL